MFGTPKRGTYTSLPLSDVLKLDDRTVNKMIKKGEVPAEFTDAKTLRKAAKRDKRLTERALSGERSIAPIIAALRGGGTGSSNYRNVPLKDRVHPAEYRRILQREAKKQGLL